ncbi:YheC/YheD family protein [Alteribacter natronophilus]|uniref:YheC/YheD family protein n=1 Tax=Alteribacter natronophilus TaxID=2583810 RepID=UPI00110DF4C5|nr:YheC/YheD family protein [Alteribacter natronophilus]TMW71267.1 hypothetical protein FGB90_15075 [Alteribacter natronophilus]
MPIRNYSVARKSMVSYVLSCYPETSVYLPKTEILNKKSLSSMLNFYKKVYIKPDKGGKSKGIIQISKTSKRFILLKSRKAQKEQYSDFSSLWRAVLQHTNGKRHIIQQAINSITKDGRQFDLRCHVIRVNGVWTVGGICARLGPQGEIVTTSHMGGTPCELDSLFDKLLDYTETERKEVIKTLHDCILKASKAVSPIYPKNYEFGIDIGLDTSKRVWIYEVNSRPLIRGNFKRLPTKEIYKRIQSLRIQAKNTQKPPSLN